MTIRIPKPVLITVAALLAVAVGVVGTLLLTGDESEPDSQSGEASTGQGDFTASDLKALDTADSAVHDGLDQFQLGLASCTGSDAVAVACFDRRYSALSASMEGLNSQFEISNPKATGDCGIRLAQARTAFVTAQAAAEEVREAFDTGSFDAVPGGAMVANYNNYRSAMDQALNACADEVPGVEIVPTG